MKEYKMITTFYLSIEGTVEADSYDEAVDKASEMAWEKFCYSREWLEPGNFISHTEEKRIV